MLATFASWLRSALCSSALRFWKAACADLWASSRVQHGLLQLRVGQLEDDGVGRDLRAGPQHDAFDPARGRRGDPADVFGTSVPEPRTWRSIEPRLTVSIQTAARSTVGAAGCSRETPMVIRSDHDQGGGAVEDATNLLLALDVRGACNINH